MCRITVFGKKGMRIFVFWGCLVFFVKEINSQLELEKCFCY